MPELAGRYPVRSLDGLLTVPESGASVPARQRSSVVLPAPSPPTTAVTWPAGTSTLTPASAAVFPYLTLTSLAPYPVRLVVALFMPQPPARRRPAWRRGAPGARAPGSGGTAAWRRSRLP